MLNLCFLAVINHLYYYYRISTLCLTRCPLPFIVIIIMLNCLIFRMPLYDLGLGSEKIHIVIEIGTYHTK